MTTTTGAAQTAGDTGGHQGAAQNAQDVDVEVFGERGEPLLMNDDGSPYEFQEDVVRAIFLDY